MVSEEHEDTKRHEENPNKDVLSVEHPNSNWDKQCKREQFDRETEVFSTMLSSVSLECRD